MAFDVTPTSGGGPYTYTSAITDKEKFDTGFYRLEFAISSSAESCPSSPEGGTLVSEAASSILATDEWIRQDSFTSGLCHSAILRVVRSRDNLIVDYMIASVDRIV